MIVQTFISFLFNQADGLSKLKSLCLKTLTFAFRRLLRLLWLPKVGSHFKALQKRKRSFSSCCQSGSQSLCYSWPAVGKLATLESSDWKSNHMISMNALLKRAWSSRTAWYFTFGTRGCSVFSGGRSFLLFLKTNHEWSCSGTSQSRMCILFNILPINALSWQSNESFFLKIALNIDRFAASGLHLSVIGKISPFYFYIVKENNGSQQQ